MMEMKWDLYPCRAFNLIDREERKKCFNYSNLRPMWFKDNCSKNDKLPNGVSARYAHQL
jgi:hypothetical protein